MMARRRAKGLSDRQKKILEVLENFQNQTGYPPSIREICDQADISSTSVVNYYLEQLEAMGYIERDGRVSRGIRLIRPWSQISGLAATVGFAVRQGEKAFKKSLDDLLQIPIAGRIFASAPVPVPPSDFAYFDAEHSVAVARSLLPGHEKGGNDLFALEVKGDSMIDAMVNEGDIVVMRPTHEARNGEMVAVWLNDRDETTLKYFYLENGRVRLQPANPTMGPIYIDDPSTVEVQGKVVMVIRKVNGLKSKN
jgi:repressor LexA